MTLIFDPMLAAEETLQQPRVASPPTRWRRRPLVVCVDDDLPTLSSLRRALRREPFLLMTTPWPHQALEWIVRKEVSVLVADERMPGMAGHELLRLAVESSPRTVAVMLTAFPDAELFGECRRAGARIMMAKPWDDARLRRTLGDLLLEGNGADA